MSFRDEILKLVEGHCAETWPQKPFRPGQDPVPVSGKVFDADDVQHLVDASLDFWLTTGRYARQFETEFAKVFGLRRPPGQLRLAPNSIALTALTSPKLGDKRLKPGDEVITVATGFPTTVNPILQNGCVPVFVDVELPTYNVDVTLLEAALSPTHPSSDDRPYARQSVQPGVSRGFLRANTICGWSRIAVMRVGAELCRAQVGTFGDLARPASTRPITSPWAKAGPC